MTLLSLSTTRRFAFLLAMLVGTVWGSRVVGSKQTIGLQLRPGTAFAKRSGRSMIVFGRKESTNEEGTPSSLSSDLIRLRGGEISIPDDDEANSSAIITKLRNVLRSILNISDDKLPLVSGFLRTCFKTVEAITGISILPPPEKKKSSTKTKKNKSKKKKKTTETTTTAKKLESSKSPSTKKKPAKKKASTKASAATKKHLSSTIKSTNPNYRIQKELKAFLKSPPPNLSVQVGANIRIWIVTILGAKDTIYEGEVFKLRIEFPKDYPTVPPSVYFLKKFMPVHEHVYTNGDICLSLLGNGWRPTMSAQSIAVSILSILSSAQSKSLPMDNANHATAKPGKYQKDWVYHDDRC